MVCLFLLFCCSFNYYYYHFGHAYVYILINNVIQCAYDSPAWKLLIISGDKMCVCVCVCVCVHARALLCRSEITAFVFNKNHQL